MASPLIQSAYTRQITAQTRLPRLQTRPLVNDKAHSDHRANNDIAILNKDVPRVSLSRKEATRPQRATTPDLDESSLAPWWNTDRYINSNVNSTPFRKQKYEPLRWAGEELLLDESGADFLIDDPFATPTTVQKTRNSLGNGKGGSAKRRRSSLTVQLKASVRGMPSPSPARQRDLTLADLTPRSQRISNNLTPRARRISAESRRISAELSPRSRRVSAGKTGNRTPKRVSVGRSLRLSKDGPGFGPLLTIDEDVERTEISLALARHPFGGTPIVLDEPRVRTPASRKSRRSSHQVYDTQEGVQETVEDARVPVDAPTPVRTTEKKSRRRSERTSIIPPTPNPIPEDVVQANPAQLPEEEDDEELHRSIPGAFDFLADHGVRPLPNTIFDWSKPEAVSEQPIVPSKPASRPVSRRPSRAEKDIVQESAVVPEKDTPQEQGALEGGHNGNDAPVLGGLAGKLAQYGDMLMGLINPNEVALVQPSHPGPSTLRLSDLSPKKSKSTALIKEKRISSHVSRQVNKPVQKRNSEQAHAHRRTGEHTSRKPDTQRPSKRNSEQPISSKRNAEQPSRTRNSEQFPPKPPKKDAVPQASAKPKDVPASDTRPSRGEPVQPTVNERVVERRQSLLPAFELDAPLIDTHTQAGEEETARSASPEIQYLGTNLVNNAPIRALEEVVTRSEMISQTLPAVPRRVSIPAVEESPALRIDKDVIPSRRAVEEILPETVTSTTYPATVPQKRPSIHTQQPGSTHHLVERDSANPFIVPEARTGLKESVVPNIETNPVQSKPKEVERPIAGKRPLKSILKKRPLEVSPRKSAHQERATKRQRVEPVPTHLKANVGKEPTERGRKDESRDGGPEARSRSRHAKAEAPKKPRSTSRAPEDEEIIQPLVLPTVQELSFSRAVDRSHERVRADDVQMVENDMEEDVFGAVVENSMENSVAGERSLHAEERHDAVEITRQRSISPVFDNADILPGPTRVLQPSTQQNSLQQHHTLDIPHRKAQELPVEVVRVVHTTAQLLPDRLFAYGTRDNDPCRLTVPQSPNFMRVQREREREKKQREQERLEELERRLEEQRRERVRKIQARGMPPVATALLAKLAGKGGVSQAPMALGLPSREFTFVSDIRPMLGDGAELVHKEQFVARRNLWEQRSLEASQESASSANSHGYERSKHTHAITQKTSTVHRRSHHRSAPESAIIGRSNAEVQGSDNRDRFIVRPVRAPPSNSTARLAEREMRRRERAVPTAREKVISQTQYLLGERQTSPRRRRRI